MCRKTLKTLLAGGILGFVAGLFLAPKPGKELQKEAREKLEEFKKLLKEKEVDKKVEKIFGEVSEKAKEAYFSTQMAVVEGLAELKGRWEELDKERYAKVVKESLEKAKKTLGIKDETIEKLREKFEKEKARFEKLTKEFLKKKKAKKASKVSRKKTK